MRTWSRTSSRASVRTFDRTESGALPVVPDPYFEYTTLLLPGNGTNGAQNNTFLDSSTNAFSITRNGNTTQGTFSPFSQTGWSNYFDGTGDYLTATCNAISGAYTFEAWIYATTATVGNIYSTSGSGGLSIYRSATGRLGVQTGSSAYIETIEGVLPATTWCHVAVTKNASNTYVMYVNGVSYPAVSTFGTMGSSYSAGTGQVGTAFNVSANFTGYISNLRVVNGTQVYTSNFTPPTAPLTAITNTELLTCQSNRFIDNSSNAFAITRNGDVSVQAFSPFNPTAAWSASTNGGSGYFDGSGDYLSIANNAAFDLGTSDCTIEAWVYPTSYASTRAVFNCFDSGANAGYSLSLTTSGFITVESAAGGYQQLTSTNNAVPLNAWSFISFTRTSSTNRIFVNGVSCSLTGTLSNALNTGSQTIRIGNSGFGGGANHFLGYIASLRVLKGTGGATSTVPTSPLTAITNTSLLTNFTNAGIYDATSKNDLETVGNAQISTTQSKFGGSSMYFDGTGDYVQAPDSPNLAFGSGDWTIEAWLYINTAKNYNGWFGKRQTSQFGLTLQTDSSGVLSISASTTGSSWALAGASLGSGYSTGTWMHVAVTRFGNTITGWKNGVSTGTQTLSGSLFAATGYPATVGSGNDAAQEFSGYIDDFRITKGIARYTSNFTPPTTAFPLL